MSRGEVPNSRTLFKPGGYLLPAGTQPSNCKASALNAYTIRNDPSGVMHIVLCMDRGVPPRRPDFVLATNYGTEQLISALETSSFMLIHELAHALGDSIGMAGKFA